jgi:glutaredoxin 3
MEGRRIAGDEMTADSTTKAQVTMYTAAYCGYCMRAERLLANKGVADIEKIRVDEIPDGRALMTARTGRRTVPQIYIGDFHVGGYDDLAALDRAGKLDGLLRGAGADRDEAVE